MIGDVLFHANVGTAWTYEEREEKIIKIWELWEKFGNKSLNEIFESKKNDEKFVDTDVQELYEYLLFIIEE